VYHFDAKMHLMLFKPVGMKEAIIRCCGGIWIAFVGEIWNHRNKCIFENESRFFGGFYCGQKEFLVLGYDLGKIDGLLLFRLMLESPLLYEVFEKNEIFL